MHPIVGYCFLLMRIFQSKCNENKAVLIKSKLAKHQMYCLLFFFFFFAETLKSLCKEYSSLEKTETEETTEDTQ